MLRDGEFPDRGRVFVHELLQGRLVVGLCVIRLEAVGRPHLLQERDQRLDRADGPVLRQKVPDDGKAVRLVEDREVREEVGVALGLRLDDIVAEAVERPDEHTPTGIARAQDDALLHLAAGLVGEGQAEDLLRLGPALCQDIGDAAGQRIRLARAGRREQQDIVRQVLHGLSLGRIQFCKFHFLHLVSLVMILHTCAARVSRRLSRKRWRHRGPCAGC